jgi:hypothetical protein
MAIVVHFVSCALNIRDLLDNHSIQFTDSREMESFACISPRYFMIVWPWHIGAELGAKTIDTTERGEELWFLPQISGREHIFGRRRRVPHQVLNQKDRGPDRLLTSYFSDTKPCRRFNCQFRLSWVPRFFTARNETVSSCGRTKLKPMAARTHNRIRTPSTPASRNGTEESTYRKA